VRLRDLLQQPGVMHLEEPAVDLLPPLPR